MAKNNSTTAPASTPATGTSTTRSTPRAAHSYDEVASELSVEYIKSADLAKMGQFNIIGATKRKAQGKFPDQVNFEVQLLEGDNAGATGIVSMKETPMRLRLHNVINEKGSIGPVLLVTGTDDPAPGNSAPWVFASPASVASGNVKADQDA